MIVSDDEFVDKLYELELKSQATGTSKYANGMGAYVCACCVTDEIEEKITDFLFKEGVTFEELIEFCDALPIHEDIEDDEDIEDIED